MLLELANETVAAAQQIGVCLSFPSRIRKGGSASGIARAGQVSVSMRGFNGRPVDNETEQQQREHASKRTVRLD